MPNCDFYALAEDSVEVLKFVFEQPGWVLYDLASPHDATARAFQSVDTVTEACPIGATPVHFHLYALDMKGAVIHEKVTFKPGAVPGATFRHDTRGWGLIQLYFGALRENGSLTPSHTNHFSPARATKWAPTSPGLGSVADWDWKAVERTSSRLVRFIRKIATSREWSRPVLPAAAQAQREGRVTCRLHG